MQTSSMLQLRLQWPSQHHYNAFVHWYLMARGPSSSHSLHNNLEAAYFMALILPLGSFHQISHIIDLGPLLIRRNRSQDEAFSQLRVLGPSDRELRMSAKLLYSRI